LAAVCALPSAFAQDARTVDQKLMKDLGGATIDELDPLPPAGDKPQGKGEQPEGPTDDKAGNLPPLLRERLESGGEAAVGDNPLLAVARRMHEVQGRIARNDAAQGTQDLQKQIVADLDKLIRQAKKSCNKSGSSSSNPQQTAARQPVGPQSPQPKPGGKAGNAPATTSSERQGPDPVARKVDMEQMRAVIKRLWGELPQHEREQLLQLPDEEFLPKYELLIEEYFRRLSEEKGR
jgi:hypothetical protein